MYDDEGFHDEGGSLEKINEDSLQRWRVVRASGDTLGTISPQTGQKSTSTTRARVPPQVLAQYRMSKSKIDLSEFVLEREHGRDPTKQKLSVAADRKFKRFETVRSSSKARLAAVEKGEKGNVSLHELPRKKPKFQLPSTTANAVSQSAFLTVGQADASPVHEFYHRQFQAQQKKMADSRNKFFGQGSNQRASPERPAKGRDSNRRVRVELPALALEKNPEGDAQTLPGDEPSQGQQHDDPPSDRRELFSKVVASATNSQEGSAARHSSSQFPRRHRQVRSKDLQSGHRYQNSHSVDPGLHMSINAHAELVVTGQKDQERTSQILERARNMSNQLEQVDYKARAFKSMQPAHLRFKQQKHIIKMKAGDVDESQHHYQRAGQGLSVDSKARRGMRDYTSLPHGEAASQKPGHKVNRR